MDSLSRVKSAFQCAKLLAVLNSEDDEFLEVSSLRYQDFLIAKQFRNNVM